MKKSLYSILSLLLVAAFLSSCRTSDVSIEQYTWKMRTVIMNNSDASVPAVGEADTLYPEAKIVNLILTAKDGVLTLIDSTNGKTYTGSYEVMNKTPDGADYKVTIDGHDGYASAAMTTYADNSQKPTLPVNLGDYSIYFVGQ